MRNKGIQVFRVSAMIIIIIYHCICYYGIWGAWFPTDIKYRNMPLWHQLCNIALCTFVFISGLLYSSYLTHYKYNRGGGNKTKIQPTSYSIPYMGISSIIDTSRFGRSEISFNWHTPFMVSPNVKSGLRDCDIIWKENSQPYIFNFASCVFHFRR